MKEETVLHGAFLVAPELIKKAGFSCRACGEPVMVVRQGMPHVIVPRMCAFTCRCGPTVVVWEDERQPTRRSWALTMKLARRTGVDVLAFNGSKPTPPGFSGTQLTLNSTPAPKMPLTPLDHDEFPAWAPRWLKKLVYEPQCSTGTHPTLRTIAKWLVIFMPLDECEGLAFHWLKVAAQKCPRVADDAELKRLLAWAVGRTGDNTSTAPTSYISQPAIDTDYLYELIVRGPTRNEFRECSPLRLYDTRERNTPEILDAWGGYSGDPNPWVCYGSKDCFFTRRLTEMRDRAYVCEQIVPSPMKQQHGKTISGYFSEHSLEATGSRLFLVVEFDFVPIARSREPSIWAPLIKRCAEKGRDILDMNAALCAHLRSFGPLWLVVYSGGKSLQSWFPCKDTNEQPLAQWYRDEALTIGACRSTWCRSQFVRMPDGSRDDGRRQCIDYCNPEILL